MEFDFKKNKYGKELLIDFGEISKNPNFIVNNEPFYVNFYEIIFITEGSGKFKLDNETIPYQRGTILLLPPNKRRQWFRTYEKQNAYYLIFEEEFISRFFNDALYLYRFNFFQNINTPSYTYFPTVEFESVLQKLLEINAEISNLKPDSEHLLRALLYYLLIKLNRNYQKNFRIEQSFYKEMLLLKFRKLLEKNIREKRRVSDYAQMLNVSNSHLNKTLNKYFAKSCSTIIKDRLLVEIKKELIFTEKTIAEIGFDLGFSEPSNLNRFFQKHVKVTPNDYRLQNDNS